MSRHQDRGDDGSARQVAPVEVLPPAAAVGDFQEPILLGPGVVGPDHGLDQVLAGFGQGKLGSEIDAVDLAGGGAALGAIGGNPGMGALAGGAAGAAAGGLTSPGVVNAGPSPVCY